MTIYIFNVVGKMMINHETLGFSIFKAMQCHCKCLKPPVSVTLFSSLGAIQTSQTWKEQFENLAIYHGHGKSQIFFFGKSSLNWFIFHSYVTGWCLPVLSWFMKPINYSYI
jgi:hypothetical protein